jgi:multidrug resistance efflux pump
MALRETARVIEVHELRAEMDTIVKRLMKIMAKNETAEITVKEATELYGMITNDFGRAATILGYDAIDVSATQYMVVLNRTAVIVEEMVGIGGWSG